jgi:hypothetical protein
MALDAAHRPPRLSAWNGTGLIEQEHPHAEEGAKAPTAMKSLATPAAALMHAAPWVAPARHPQFVHLLLPKHSIWRPCRSCN